MDRQTARQAVHVFRQPTAHRGTCWGAPPLPPNLPLLSILGGPRTRHEGDGSWPDRLMLDAYLWWLQLTQLVAPRRLRCFRGLQPCAVRSTRAEGGRHQGAKPRRLLAAFRWREASIVRANLREAPSSVLESDQSGVLELAKVVLPARSVLLGRHGEAMLGDANHIRHAWPDVRPQALCKRKNSAGLEADLE